MARRRTAASVAAAALGIAAAATLALGPGASASSHLAADGGVTEDQGRPAHLDHIFVIMLENHSQSSVIDNANAPYITSLAHGYGMASSYYGVTHPSMPNYLASIAGDNFGIQDDHDERVVNLNRPTLVDSLEARHISWSGYFENLPANKTDSFSPSSANPLYAKKHNPFMLFDNIAGDSSRVAKVKDYSSLADDLSSGHAPAFAYIVPNQCHDMHGGVYGAVGDGAPCPYGSAKDDANDAALKAKADDFVKTTVGEIMASPVWKQNSAIFVVTDENDFNAANPDVGKWDSADGCCDSPYVAAADPRVATTWPGGTYGGGLIPAVVVTSKGPRHVVSQTPYNHYSMLATIEQNWQLPYVGHSGDRAGGVVPMDDLLRRG